MIDDNVFITLKCSFHPQGRTGFILSRRPHRVEHISTFFAFTQWNSQQFHLRAAWKYEYERDREYGTKSTPMVQDIKYLYKLMSTIRHNTNKQNVLLRVCTLLQKQISTSIIVSSEIIY